MKKYLTILEDGTLRSIEEPSEDDLLMVADGYLDIVRFNGQNYEKAVVDINEDEVDWTARIVDWEAV